MSMLLLPLLLPLPLLLLPTLLLYLLASLTLRMLPLLLLLLLLLPTLLLIPACLADAYGCCPLLTCCMLLTAAADPCMLYPAIPLSWTLRDAYRCCCCCCCCCCNAAADFDDVWLLNSLFDDWIFNLFAIVYLAFRTFELFFATEYRYYRYVMEIYTTRLHNSWSGLLKFNQ